MPKIRSRWPQQQHTARINWGDRLTKGLRHAIVPALAGNDNVIPDLVDKNCVMYLHASAANANSWSPQIALIDTQIYQHSSYTHWLLGGPSLIWTPNTSFTVFVRYWPVSNPTCIWTVGYYTLGMGWEMLQGAYVTPSAIFGQFGSWYVGGLDAYSVDSGFANQWQTAAFSYDGVSKRVRAYKDGVMGRDSVYTGALWTSMGGGADYNQSWRADGATDSGAGYLFLSHIYMWEAELQPADVMRLTTNPTAIFTSPRPTLWMSGLEIPGEVIPPEPTVGSPGHHHILGAV